ncbi:MAG TPA: ubiquinol-cytochrome c reductase iron-sulfur subunit N-terminal domain-containing protein, partial [Methylophilaceae bacterium]
MAKPVVDHSKRRFLVAATATAGVAGAVTVAVPFVSSMLPSERAKAAGAPVEVDISNCETGVLKTAEWRGKVIWIIKRSKQMLA